MFWGVTILGGRRYTQTVEKSYHISKAVLDVPIDGKVTGKRVQLMLEHNKTQHVLCNLDSDKTNQVDLDLIFTEGEEVTFYLNGEGAVHLSGYVLEYNEFDEEDDDDDENLFDEESEVEEVPVKKNSGDVLNQNAKRAKNDVFDSGFVSSKKAKTNGSIEVDVDDEEDSDDALGNLDEEFDSADEEDDEEMDDEEDDEEEDEEDEPKQVKPAPKVVNGQAPKGLQQQKGTPGQKGQQQGGQGGQKNTPGKPNNNQTPGKQNNTPGKPNNNNQTPKGGQPNQNNKFGQNKGQNNSPIGQNKPNNNNQKGPQQQNQQKGGQNNSNNKFQQINKQKGGSFTPDQKASKNFNKFNKNKGRKSFA